MDELKDKISAIVFDRQVYKSVGKALGTAGEIIDLIEKEAPLSSHSSVGLIGLVDKWQERSDEMYSKARNWIETPSDARFMGKAEAIRQCILELQVELRKAD